MDISEYSEPDLNILCRLCLAEAGEDISHHNIFEENLANKIILILGLDVILKYF
jgi:hypothetical protein